MKVAVLDTTMERLSRFYPVSGIAMELVRFDTQLMESADISGVEYQQGELAGYELKEYLLRTHSKTFMGFKTGDIVIANVPKGKFAGRHFGRVTIRQRKSFILNGFDVNPGYIDRAHFADGYEYEHRTQNARLNARQKKALGHSLQGA